MAEKFELGDLLSVINTSSIIPADPAVALRGGITALSVKELVPVKDKDGNVKLEYTDNLVIRADNPWEIILDWKLEGTLLSSNYFKLPGNWVIKAFLEGWGANALDYDLKEIKIAVEPTLDQNQNRKPSPWEYTATINVAPNDVKMGAYRLALTLTYLDEKDIPGPMAGFVEFPDMIQIYNPK